MKSRTCYAFEEYTVELSKQCINSLKMRRFDQPLTGLWLQCAQSEYHPGFILINDKEKTQEIEIPQIQNSLIPSYMGDENEAILEKFVEENDLNSEDIFWGDYYKLPWSLLCFEMIVSSVSIVAFIRSNSNVELAKRFDHGISVDDERYGMKSAKDFEQAARMELKKLGPKKNSFLKLCYRDSAKISFFEK
ncbi:hypothetical protein K1X84_12945 [bacterium]|nr:hypothetical protein [bacterium]